MSASPKDTTVGFIGLGIMGAPMAGHLLKAGYKLTVHNRTKAKAEPLLAQGATWAESVPALAQACDVVVTIIGYPADVEATYLGKDGLVAHAKPGAVLIDMTTSTPELAQRIAGEAAKRKVAVLDAPVSGGAGGAENAKLTIMVGGEQAAFDRVKDLLGKMGTNVVLQGGPGAGQHTKAVNQIIISSTMLCIAEALAYARKVGLDPETVLQSISKGSAASFHLDNTAPKMIAKDTAPGFFVHHLVKDLEIAQGAANNAGLRLPALETALQRYRQLRDTGHDQDGAQAIYTLYEK